MDTTGMITAVEAAQWLDVSYKTVLRHIKSGDIPAVKVAPNRYAIKIADLPARLGVKSMLARLAAIEARMDNMERKSVNLSVRAYNAQESLYTPIAVSSIMSDSIIGPDVAYKATLAAFDEAINTRADIARFLGNHGIRASTAEKWKDCPLSLDGALLYAKWHIQTIGWRARQANMRLFECDQTDCICHQILGG